MGIALPSRGRRGIWCCRIDDRERVDNVLVCFSRYIGMNEPIIDIECRRISPYGTSSWVQYYHAFVVWRNSKTCEARTLPVWIERTDKYNQLKLVFHLFVSVRPFEAKSKGHIRCRFGVLMEDTAEVIHQVHTWFCSGRSARAIQLWKKLPEVQREIKFIVNLCLSDSLLFQHFYVEMDVILIWLIVSVYYLQFSKVSNWGLGSGLVS